MLLKAGGFGRNASLTVRQRATDNQLAEYRCIVSAKKSPSPLHCHVQPCHDNNE